MTRWSPAAGAAERLKTELERYEITSDAHPGNGVAMVSVWTDLMVWTDGKFSYMWWGGAYAPNSTTRRRFTHSPVDDPALAARRVASRYAVVRAEDPHGRMVAEIVGAVTAVVAVGGADASGYEADRYEVDGSRSDGRSFSAAPLAEVGCWNCEPDPAVRATDAHRRRVFAEPLCAACRIVSDVRRQLDGLEPLQPETAEKYPHLVMRAHELLAPELARSPFPLHATYRPAVL
ncbi:hypothetical protein IMZ11_38760 [Microtetraspora sp. AC03309]|uniref:hypothetical protein n=1 Tax=Microtetraspora sp. AC03309 TaxID=2779376 RepID=UPI001E4FA253|nr:hypothetical protein [Microtetraspora sp. AC03309]MCC5581560.1 hypothetical protein [Microtetraspora sp. AC03309]